MNDQSIWRKPFVLQALALAGIVVLVHSIYLVVIRPNAASLLAEQEALTALSDSPAPPPTSIYIVIKDYEQEACFIMLLWAMAIMGIKFNLLNKNMQLLKEDLLQIEEGLSILPTDARTFTRPLQALPDETRNLLLPHLLLSALERFSSSQSVSDTTETVNLICNQTDEQMDSELSMIRYIAWAIPSVGFIGTVRGIGAALAEAYKAVEGDITGVTSNLGVAFNSTLVALLLSILLMFLLHQLQFIQERLVLSARRTLDQQLIRHLKAPDDFRSH